MYTHTHSNKEQHVWRESSKCLNPKRYTGNEGKMENTYMYMYTDTWNSVYEGAGRNVLTKKGMREVKKCTLRTCTHTHHAWNSTSITCYCDHTRTICSRSTGCLYCITQQEWQAIQQGWASAETGNLQEVRKCGTSHTLRNKHHAHCTCVYCRCTCTHTCTCTCSILSVFFPGRGRAESSPPCLLSTPL